VDTAVELQDVDGKNYHLLDHCNVQTCCCCNNTVAVVGLLLKEKKRIKFIEKNLS
jgi:hypothetical protein